MSNSQSLAIYTMLSIEDDPKWNKSEEVSLIICVWMLYVRVANQHNSCSAVSCYTSLRPFETSLNQYFDHSLTPIISKWDT